MTKEEFLKVCWPYYKVLEESFIETFRYIEIDVQNFSAFSFEFVRQLQCIGAEIDSVMKIVCGFRSNERKNTGDYYPIVTNNFQDITTREIRVKGMAIKPFDGWNAQQPTKSLFWYDAYNEIKHGRSDNFKKATMKNVLYSLAALYLLESYYIRSVSPAGEIDVPIDNSEIFNIIGWNSKWVPATQIGAFICDE